MKYATFAVAMCTFVGSVHCLADNARFRVRVVDERTSLPISGVKIKSVFTEYTLNWANATIDHEVVGKTDDEGLYSATGDTNCGEAGFRICENDGFYCTSFVKVPFDLNRGRPIPAFQWWNPDNQLIRVALQRIENPIPLFVKWVKLRDFKKGIGGFDGTNSLLRFDLMKGDWLAPYGKGEIADMTVSSKVKITGTGKLRKPYPDFGWSTLNFYELQSEVSFSESDGITEQASKPRDGLKIRCIHNEPAGKCVARVLGLRQVFERKGKDWHSEGFSDMTPNRCYTFRVRSRRDDKGKLVEAYYGKIYGDFEFEGDDKKGLIGVKFLYYLNPKSLDRNLEWDMKTNLCPTAGKHESRQP